MCVRIIYWIHTPITIFLKQSQGLVYHSLLCIKVIESKHVFKFDYILKIPGTTSLEIKVCLSKL